MEVSKDDTEGGGIIWSLVCEGKKEIKYSIGAEKNHKVRRYGNPLPITPLHQEVGYNKTAI